MAMKLCFEHENGPYPVQLFQQGVDRFTVAYGHDVKPDLNYEDAASALGASLMHMLACEHKLDNRRKRR